MQRLVAVLPWRPQPLLLKPQVTEGTALEPLTNVVIHLILIDVETTLGK